MNDFRPIERNGICAAALVPDVDSNMSDNRLPVDISVNYLVDHLAH
jgi:hypothetical protein